jgi:hypothetical protein
MTRLAMIVISLLMVCYRLLSFIIYCTSSWNWEKLLAEHPLPGQAVRTVNHSSKTPAGPFSSLQWQFRLYIPFLVVARPQPQFPHSCVFERFIYSQDQSTYFLQQNRQTHRGNI